MLGGGAATGDTTASVLMSSSGGGDAAASGASGAHGVGGGEIAATATAAAAAMLGSNNDNNNNENSGEVDDKARVDEGDRSFGGNRWPRQETLALLKIRSDMDVAFREASVKGPLWEEVSRKLAELGYHRSAKKCKEKFENVYKYHKRTKEGRTGKSEGKTYRFCQQLEALENQPSLHSPEPPKPQAQAMATTATTAAINPPTTVSHVTVPSTTSIPPTTQSIVVPSINYTIPSFPSLTPPVQLPPYTAAATAAAATNPTHPPHTNIPSSFPSISADLMTDSTSSSTSSDLELEARRKRKRKWKDFFERLMKEVIEKQEQMQKRFLEAIERREHERMVREEAWRMQEMARINREREILAQERSVAAAKDAALMAFLQRVSEQQTPGQPLIIPTPSQQPAAPAQAPQPQPQAAPVQAPVLSQPQATPPAQTQPSTSLVSLKVDEEDHHNLMPANSSRWPKVEVQALIKLRTNLDAKYQESGPKGPLWEEISSAMAKLGYNRNAKRCKEKWENINKYFKKVKESSKRRPEDSKTCPYFHQLDALYRERSSKTESSSSTHIKPENAVPLMVRPEQQWPPPPPPSASSEPQHRHDSVMKDIESGQMDQILEEEEDEDKDGDEEEEDGGDFEIVASKPVQVNTG